LGNHIHADAACTSANAYYIIAMNFRRVLVKLVTSQYLILRYMQSICIMYRLYYIYINDTIYLFVSLWQW